MNTIYLKGEPKKLEALSEGAVFFKRNAYRAVVVTKGATVKLTRGVSIMKKVRGDDRRMGVEWTERGIVQQLNDDFVARAPVPERERQESIEAWSAARSELESARLNLASREEELSAACANLVRCHGSGPITVDGNVYDPVPSRGGDSLSYRPRAKRSA